MVGVYYALAAMVALTLLLPAASTADQRTYALDEDPIRLGVKAFEQGRLAEAENRFLEAIAADYQVHRAHFGLAEIAVQQGRYEAAEPRYREALQRRADYAEAHAGLGLLLLRFGREFEAAQEFDLALAQKSDLWAARYGHARLLLARGENDQAKKLLDKGSKLRGLQDGEDRYHYGMALYQLARDDVGEAEKHALLAMNLNPADPEYAALVGQIYQKRGAPTLAINAYEQALAAQGMTPTAPMLHALGVLYQKVQRYNEARDSYSQAVAIDSTYAPALKDLAGLYRLANQPDRAARIYLRYTQLKPDDGEALLGLAEACFEARLYDQAVVAAREAVALDASSAEACLVLARAGIRGQDPQARAEATQILADLPDSLVQDPLDWVAVAGIQAGAQQYVEARASLQRALRLDPRHANAYFQLGVIDLRTGQAEAAIGRFEQAIALNPDAAAYHVNLGIADFQAQRIAEAIPSFRRALELDEGNTFARLLLAQALASTDELAEAEAQYQRVLAVEPTNAKALRGLGFCYIRRSNYSDAIRTYQAATDADPANADSWAGLGNAYLGSGDLGAAERAFGKARAIDPGNATLRKGLELLNQARQGAGGN